jgi:hypothetical protein
MSGRANSTTRSITIETQASPVFEYLARAENLPEWAPAFAETVRRDGDDIVVTSGGDERRFRFRTDALLSVIDFLAAVSRNQFATAATIRLVPRASTTEVLFTLMRIPNESDKELEDRARAVELELSTLRERFMPRAASPA